MSLLHLYVVWNYKLDVIANATKLMKSHHRKFKVLLSYVQGQDEFTEQQLIKYAFKQITIIHAASDYIEPLEWYIRKYKLNDYDMKEVKEI